MTLQMPNWYRVENNGIRYYCASNLQSTGLIKHGYSTRIGGKSLTPFDTLNLGLAVNDNKAHVLENRRLFASVLGLNADKIVVPSQTHGKKVKRVTSEHAGRGAFDYADSISDTDALITNTRGLTLSLHFADCGSVFFLDPVNRAIGLAHAGWRGTASKIVIETIESMKREFGSDPKDIQAAIGPCIGRCCYEVGKEVAEQFFESFPNNENVIEQSLKNKWHVNLKTANYSLLVQAGIKDENISVSEHCTCCLKDEFFSYRRDGKTGRMSGWISLI